jgi:colanic acid/amylovoran biosynthesis glycosyltransferase
MPRNLGERIIKSLGIIIKNFHRYPIEILKSLNVLKYGSNALSLSLFYSISYFLDRQFDIIHCHFGPNGIYGTQLKQIGVKSKIITTFHGYDMSLLLSRNGDHIYRDVFHYCDLCLPISDRWKLKLIRLGGNESKIIVHRMGINLDNYRYSERRLPASGSLKILTIGRLCEKKGYEYSIRAVAKILANGNNITYIIAGDGPLRNEMKRLAEELKIKQRVIFVGAVEQDEVRKLYQQSHIFILPAVTASNGDQEGIPVVLMEAAASGLPIISTFHSGIPEIVSNEKSGFLVPERDVDSLADKLEYLIEHPEVWPLFGREGHRIVKETYDTKKLIPQLEKLFKALLEDENIGW